MNQQEFFSRGGYANLNLAPPNTRQSYNTATGVPGAGSMRLGPRPLDASQYAGHFPYLDDRFNSYSDVRHSRMQSPQAYGDSLHANSFVTSNAQAWQHNSGATTINGAMDAGRSRNAGRPPLPTEWFTVPEPNLGSQNPYTTAQYALPGHYSQSMGPMNGGLLNSGPLNGGPSLGSSDRSVYATGLERQATPKSLAPDLIPTAIVIKNIPFNVRKETLAMLMQELNLPTPYAFNYHFDNGIFRGLAFANFQNPEDTWQVIDALNGFDVSGRKLRVEYKKMLPEAERERIEREKREKRGQLEEQHQPLKLSHQTSMHQLQPTPHPPSAAARSDAIPGDLDMNDNETLNYFTELTLFKNDPAREIIIFPPSMTSTQRRIVHTLAHHMGLNHRSVGEGGQRQLHVLKPETAMSPTTGSSIHAPAVHQNRSLNRAATIDFAETRSTLGQYNSHTLRERASRPTLELPDSPDINLRGVKSFADLRDPRSTPSPAPSLGAFGLNGGHNSSVAIYGEYSAGTAFQGQNNSLTTPTTPGATGGPDVGILLPSLGSLNLGESFPAAQGRPLQTPGAIGSQRPSVNGPGSRGQPERQPLVPTAGERGDFGAWRRPNGHMQRDSDGSDSGTRGTAGSGGSRFQ